ncbi:Arylsulfatase [Rubripirellula tenax]|uniref:Arylsulfatase n=1 Tax=Rubripirellula tenax TaxID=2528015 RepID=A0A5C6F4J0_9BACT|nr:sulfatase [Rubripirellula tenax]TWU56663.1 Arylsulfatase [Rubripirellula tenax]
MPTPVQDFQRNDRFVRLLLSISAILAMAVSLDRSSASAQTAKPNIVFILADDLGWSDTTLFETTKFYKTPNIERLAARGMTFTHAYSSSPLCSPTRASILTGLSPARTGITSPTCHLPQVVLQAESTAAGAANMMATIPSSVTRLDPKYYTLAEMLSDNGYATGHFGKWHLGPEPYSPLQHGFDVDIPHWPGPGPAGSYVAPWKYQDFDPQTPDEHIEDRMALEAVAFMEAHRNEPFFLNYWMFSVHAPFDAKAALIEKYRKNIDPNDPQRSPTYAAMVESMDDAVGSLLDTLDRLQIADNTMIVFASDNGGNMYNEVDGTSATSNAPLKGGKATMYEGGVRGPAIVTLPGIVDAGTRSDEVIQSSDFYPTILELLSIAPQGDQSFDGISIAPALRGDTLQRGAIFTFFPHSPGIPDWLPPAVSVHQDDWKLIRIFHGGENGKHRFKLFDLNNDIGESNDLSASQPQRVAAMDSLIEAFLTDTQAALPLPNPNFDPSKYDPDKEGKAALKGGADAPPRTPPRKATKPVAGWQAEGNCTVSVNDGSLVFSSDGGDPHAVYSLDKPVPPGKRTLQFTMTSNSTGNGQVFWHEQGIKPPFIADRSVSFDVTHDGKPQTYSVPFTTSHPILAVRMDPSRGPGTLTITDLCLIAEDGTVLKTWQF